MLSETLVLNKERNVTLTTFIQPVGGEFRYINKRPAILIIPGGGYQYCSDREKETVAFEYLKEGYQVFILCYSVKEDAVWPNPLNDYEEAMELIRSKAEEWNIYRNKIAVLGFSAGGHLASAAATMSKNRPNAAILGYAVTIEETAHMCSPTAPATVDKVDSNTCPCFVFATRTDAIVPITNSIQFINALDKAGISFESHIYGYGPHGFSTGNTCLQEPESGCCNRVSHWVSDSIEWLKDLFGGFRVGGEMSTPQFRPKMYENDNAFLSIYCSVGYLLQHPEGKKVIEDLIETAKLFGFVNEHMEAVINQGKNMDTSSATGRMTLKDALLFAKLPVEEIEQIDEQLGKIPNK